MFHTAKTMVLNFVKGGSYSSALLSRVYRFQTPQTAIIPQTSVHRSLLDVTYLELANLFLLFLTAPISKFVLTILWIWPDHCSVLSREFFEIVQLTTILFPNLLISNSIVARKLEGSLHIIKLHGPEFIPHSCLRAHLYLTRLYSLHHIRLYIFIPFKAFVALLPLAVLVYASVSHVPWLSFYRAVPYFYIR